jgi:hypothetical protein
MDFSQRRFGSAGKKSVKRKVLSDALHRLCMRATLPMLRL